MAQPDDWTIEYYVEDSGRIPVREFFLELDPRTFARFQASLEQLRMRNVRAGFPLVRPVEAKLWELREESNTNILRVLYFFYTGKRIVLLHGFAKKAQRLQRNDIETALRRLSHFQEREGGER
jgi:phage-related protein